jgi:hypothetical protein
MPFVCIVAFSCCQLRVPTSYELASKECFVSCMFLMGKFIKRLA